MSRTTKKYKSRLTTKKDEPTKGIVYVPNNTKLKEKDGKKTS